jgi:hypothetical protein
MKIAYCNNLTSADKVVLLHSSYRSRMAEYLDDLYSHVSYYAEDADDITLKWHSRILPDYQVYTLANTIVSHFYHNTDTLKADPKLIAKLFHPAYEKLTVYCLQKFACTSTDEEFQEAVRLLFDEPYFQA